MSYTVVHIAFTQNQGGKPALFVPPTSIISFHQTLTTE